MFPLQIVTGDPPISWNWTIENDTVYINNSMAYLSATPHTLVDDGWVEFELESKQLSGSIDVGFGFNSTEAKPKKIEIWRNYTHNMTGRRWVEQYMNMTLWVTAGENLGMENYSSYDVDVGNENNTYLWNLSCTSYIEPEGWYNYSLIIAFESKTPPGMIPDINYTFFYYDEAWETYYYDSTFWDWKPFNFDYTVVNYDFRDADTWYLFRDIPIQEDVRYKIRGWIDIPFGGLEGSSGKYWWVMKPHNKNIHTAIQDGYFLYLDPWWNSNYKNYRKITVESDYIDNSLKNFPLLVVLDNSSGDYNFHNGGADIEFVSTDNSTQFNHEIELFDNSGDTFCWVNISEILTSGSDYSFLVYYNNNDDSTVNHNPEDVWDSNYMMVLHMSEHEGSPTVFQDSTSNNNDGTLTDADTDSVEQATGKVGYCIDLAGDTDYITTPAMDLDTACTYSAWIEPDAAGYDIWDHRVDGVGIQPAYVSIGNDHDLQWYSSTVGDNTYEDTNIANDIYTYISLTRGDTYSSDAFRCYKDGSYLSGKSDDNTDHGSKVLTIGARYSHDSTFYNGKIDEIRVSKIDLNDSWIKAGFHTMNQTTGFLTFGSEQSQPGVHEAPVNSNPYPSNDATEISYPPAQFNITISSAGGYGMNITWQTNESGSWLNMQTNSSANGLDNGTYYCYNTSWVDDCGIKYYWRVVTNDSQTEDNDTYSFTTVAPEDTYGGWSTYYNVTTIQTGGDVFMCLLYDTDGTLILDNENKTWLYYVVIPEVGDQETYCIEMYVDNLTLVGSGEKVKAADTGCKWACAHIVIKIEDGFYLMFYSSEPDSGDRTVRAATCSTPNGTFVKVDGFEITPSDVKAECDNGFYKWNESATEINASILIYDSDLGYNRMRWANITIDLVNDNVSYDNEKTPYLGLTNFIGGNSGMLGGGNMEANFTINNRRVLYYEHYKSTGASIDYSWICRAVANNSDPLFLNPINCSMVLNTTALGLGYKGTEKHCFYQRGDYLYLFGENTTANPNKGTDVFRFTTDNYPPSFNNISPINNAIGQSFNPTLSVLVNDTEGNSMTIQFWTNASGNWLQLGTENASATNDTYNRTTSNMNSYSTIYYWSVNATDPCGSDSWSNETYHFTTEAEPDTTPPTVVINFAGNLSDSGGPYWRPPGESTQLTGIWSDGYYTNDSRQSEGWMYINLTVSDGDGVPNVWLQWLNETTWTNYTYAFLNTTGGFFEFNTSGNISTAEGYNYSFDIVANDTFGNSKLVWWNKTDMSGGYGRRYVQLNCTPVNISYAPYYFYDVNYEDDFKLDRLWNDQGTTDATTDTGVIDNITPSDTMQFRACGLNVGWWFNDSICLESFTLNNIYFHIWWSSDDDNGLDGVGWMQSRGMPTYFTDFNDSYSIDVANNRSNIYYDNEMVTYSDDYHLDTHKLVTTPASFTDNNMYELLIMEKEDQDGTSICNRSITSFVIFNIPDNATLNASHADTDSDGLSDWTELYVNYTNPFLADTDNDGVSDYDETLSGSDPNNYTDTIPIAEFDVDVSPDIWMSGDVGVNTDIQENFTFWQNGSATIDITIGINSTNFTYVNYASWLNLGHDRYCANFTNDAWATENMIEPGYPPSSVLNSSFAPGNFTFGVRIWMPRTVTYSNKQEDFKIVLVISESS